MALGDAPDAEADDKKSKEPAVFVRSDGSDGDGNCPAKKERGGGEDKDSQDHHDFPYATTEGRESDGNDPEGGGGPER